MKQELERILKILEDNHIDFYANVDKQTIEKYIEELLESNKLEDKYDLYYIINKVIKKALMKNDSHTVVLFKDNERVPLKFSFFNNKLYVTDAKDSKLLYSEVVEVNGIDINEVLSLLEETITYSTKGWKEFCLARDIASISKLRALKIFNKSAKAEYTFLKNNEKKKILFKNDPLNSKKIPNYTYDIKDNIMHIIYNSCEDEEQMNKLVDIVKQHSEINNYIIDLRGNIGGNSNIIKPLIEVLKGKKIITLVNNAVYSSGIFAIVDLKNIGSIFVGTEVGSSINCFCNVKRIELDDFIVLSSCKYYYFDGNKIVPVSTKEEYEKLDEKYKENYFFKPDYLVEEKLEDLINNNDVYMAKAKEIIG
jgi:hypothetical protein